MNGNNSLSVLDELQAPTREEFYTNYPFFKYWNRENNEELQQPDPINLYIHIPYCIQICDYCFYNKELIKSQDQVNEYVDYLCREIQMVSERYSLKNRLINSIYIGGGTPSVLTEPQFRKLIETLHKYLKVDNPEFTFEAEPGTFREKKIKLYQECGVNRISMGVQAFNDEIIKLSSRHHTVEQAFRSIDIINEVGGIKTNVDLLSGLLGETMSTWNGTLDHALNLDIDMITIYKLKTYANTNFFKKGVMKNEIDLPSAEEEVEYMSHALTRLESSDFQSWTTFAFAKEGTSHSYVERTWRGEDLFAFGVSGFGKIGGLTYQNLNNTKLYYQNIDKEKLPIFRSFKLTHKDQIVRELLLCAIRLNSYTTKEFEQKFGFNYLNFVPDTIEMLSNHGYLHVENDDVVLTKKGILYGDFISKVIAEGVKNRMGADKMDFVY